MGTKHWRFRWFKAYWQIEPFEPITIHSGVVPIHNGYSEARVGFAKTAQGRRSAHTKSLGPELEIGR